VAEGVVGAGIVKIDFLAPPLEELAQSARFPHLALGHMRRSEVKSRKLRCTGSRRRYGEVYGVPTHSAWKVFARV